TRSASSRGTWRCPRRPGSGSTSARTSWRATPTASSPRASCRRRGRKCRSGDRDGRRPDNVLARAAPAGVQAPSPHSARPCPRRPPMSLRIAVAVTLSLVACGCATAPPRPIDVTNLGVADAVAMIRAGQITSVELTRAYLARAQANRDLNAFITLDEEGALKAARHADTQLALNLAKGVLHGVPLVIKDNTHVAGLPNTAGTPALRDFGPSDHPPPVTRLLQGGGG